MGKGGGSCVVPSVEIYSWPRMKNKVRKERKEDQSPLLALTESLVCGLETKKEH